MSAITKALTDIKYKIPKEILNITFNRKTFGVRNRVVSLDEKIMAQVIRPKVMMDCNLIGGEMMYINITSLSHTTVDDSTLVYHIPPNLTNGRNIVSALAVSSAYLSQPTTEYGLGQNDISIAMTKMSDSYSMFRDISSALIDVVGDNVIVVRNVYSSIGLTTLKCIVENEENMGNLTPRAYMNFSKLCVLAVKGYIYNYNTISMGDTWLEGGMEVSSVKNYIDNLADADEMYDEFLETKWSKTAFSNDIQRKTALYRKLILPGL